MDSAANLIRRSDSLQFALLAGVSLLLGVSYRYCRFIPPLVFETDWMLFFSLGSVWGATALVLALVCSLFLTRVSWAEEEGFDPRVLLFPAIFIFAWCYSVYEYNFFVGHSHIVDRSVLVLLALLTFLRPAFLSLFVVQLGVILAHLSHPLKFSWTDKSPLIDVLLIAVVYLLGKRFRLFKPQSFFAVVISFLALYYFRPGIGKMQLEWLRHDDLSNLFLAAVHQNAWLTNLHWLDVSWLAEYVFRLGPVLMIGSYFFELFVVMFLCRRKYLVFGLLALVGMHLGIFLSSGILFWKWIVLCLSVVLAVVRVDSASVSRLFNTRFSLCLLGFLIVGTRWYTPSPVLAWLDTPMSVTYHFKVVADSGRVYQIPPRNFEPFDLQFSQARFGFFANEPLLVGCLGMTQSPFICDLTAGISDASTLKALREKYGQRVKYKTSVEEMREFLKRYVLRERVNEARGLFSYIPKPPQHIWSNPAPIPEPVWDWGETPVSIKVFRNTVVHRDFTAHQLENTEVLHVEVGGGS